MRRADLEHVIRAAADLAADDEIVVIGSQAVLGQFPDAPAELRVSAEADVHDLVVSKCVAGREKDLRYLRAAARHRLVDRATLLARVAGTDLADGVRAAVVRRVEDAFRGV